MVEDWRAGSHSIGQLVANLHKPENRGTFSDVTFKLCDGSVVAGHRLVLALASPFFEAKFHGPWVDRSNVDVVDVCEVSGETFGRVMDFIYTSGSLSPDLDAEDLWELLEAAHMYLVSGLIQYCEAQLASVLAGLTDAEELVEHVNRAALLFPGGAIYVAGVAAVTAQLGEVLGSHAWLQLAQAAVTQLVLDTNLKVTEGELFSAVVRWCKANTSAEQDAVTLFMNDFADKFIVNNISMDAFVKDIGPSNNFIGEKLFRTWTFEILQNKIKDASRFALNPYKVHRARLEKRDFLEPRIALANGPNDGNDIDIWEANDEFADVDIDIRIYQKISEGVHVPRGKFGIMVDITHMPKEGSDITAVTERVSIKMVAKKADGTVVKKLFKPIEDAGRNSTGADGLRTNTFVLSKNREERVQWHEMEVVVIVDRRTRCNIKGISEKDFVAAVCSGPTMSYLEKATKFSFELSLTLEQALKQMTSKLEVCCEDTKKECCKWHYIFTKVQ